MKPTDIIFILDKSSSMSSMRNEAIAGYNNFVREQQALEGEARMTLLLFNTRDETVYSRVPIHQVPLLNTDTYVPEGMTAYYDALCHAVDDMKSSGHLEGVIIVVLTDGEENSSNLTAKDVKKRVIEQRENEGWKFVFLAAGERALSDAVQNLGISKDASIQYDASSAEGYKSAYNVTSDSVSIYRSE